jgi:hypothetical protein
MDLGLTAAVCISAISRSVSEPYLLRQAISTIRRPLVILMHTIYIRAPPGHRVSAIS